MVLVRQAQPLQRRFPWDLLHGNAIFHINKIFFYSIMFRYMIYTTKECECVYRFIDPL